MASSRSWSGEWRGPGDQDRQRANPASAIPGCGAACCAVALSMSRQSARVWFPVARRAAVTTAAPTTPRSPPSTPAGMPASKIATQAVCQWTASPTASPAIPPITPPQMAPMTAQRSSSELAPNPRRFVTARSSQPVSAARCHPFRPGRAVDRNRPPQAAQGGRGTVRLGTTARLAARLRARHRSLRLPDALSLAAALAADAELLTLDIRLLRIQAREERVLSPPT